MRQKILKIYIEKKEMQTVKHFGCRKIPYIKKSDELPVKQCDFIIFTDEESEFLRNIWELSDREVEYTSLLPIKDGGRDFSLLVVTGLLYESIMHLRHRAAVRKTFLSKTKFPLKMVENEIEMIRSTLLLLEGKIDIADYRKKLEGYSQKADSYSFESADIILQEYGWNYTLNEKGFKPIEKIKAAVCEMEACVKDSKQWEKINRIAYSIHNEAGEIIKKP